MGSATHRDKVEAITREGRHNINSFCATFLLHPPHLPFTPPCTWLTRHCGIVEFLLALLVFFDIQHTCGSAGRLKGTVWRTFYGGHFNSRIILCCFFSFLFSYPHSQFVSQKPNKERKQNHNQHFSWHSITPFNDHSTDLRRKETTRPLQRCWGTR